METARKAVQAGADWIITGNLTESFDDADELQSFDRIYLNNEFLKFTLLVYSYPSQQQPILLLKSSHHHLSLSRWPF